MSEPLIDVLHRVATAFDRHGFSYALIGALARNAWARPRATTDVDFAIAVAPQQMDQLRVLFGEVDLLVRKERPAEDGGPVPELFLLRDKTDPGVRVDLLVAHTPFEASVLSRRMRAHIAGGELWLASPEDMLVYKLIAGRSRDLADVEEIGRARAIIGAEVDWAYVEKWCDDFGVLDRLRSLRRTLDLD